MAEAEAREFDIVVLGGGPAGYATALYGAAAGLNVAMVEDRRVGGTCLHRGCIPAKELLQTAEVFRTVLTASEFGVDAGVPTIDLSRAQVRKQQVIDQVTKGLESLLAGRKVTVVIGRGELIDADTVRVPNGQGFMQLTGANVVIATGSEARSLPGLDFDGRRVLSSDHVLGLTELPPRAAIIGGGVVGCEFASMLVDMGTKVTMLEALPRILAGTDVDAGNVVARSFRKRGIDIHLDARDGIEGAEELTVAWEAGGESHSADVDVVIVSVGRAPSSKGIGLEAAGVTVDDRGFVVVDGQMRTNVAGVYAAGDVVDTPALAHVGFAEAIVIVKTILDEPVVPVDYAKVPWGIYTQPEIAYCGLTEEQARAQFGDEVEVSKARFGGDARAVIIGETDGLVKLVADGDGTLVGVHIAGPWATELLGEGYLSVNWEASATELAALIHPHPTLGEMIGEAALALTGRRLH